jgi:hypothetical protein
VSLCNLAVRPDYSDSPIQILIITMSYWDYCVTVPSRLREVSELAKTILFETRTTPPFNNEETTTELELAAKRCLPTEKIIGDAGILVDTLLVSMMDYAADDAAKRYTACAIITAQSKGLLMMIAEIWFYYLFCPSASVKLCP